MEMSIIVPTGEALSRFRVAMDKLGGFREVDVPDVVSRLIAVLNAEGWWIGALENFANEYVLKGTCFAVVDSKIICDAQIMKYQIVLLGVHLKEEFERMGMLTQAGPRGYFYNQLLGDDLVVSPLPCHGHS